MRLLSLSGEGSRCRGRGRPFQTLIRKVSGLPRYRPGRFMGKAAMTNAVSLAGMWRCVSPHVFAIVIGALWQPAFRVARPWRRRSATHKDHEKDVRAETYQRS